MSYAKEVLNHLIKRNPGEPEFHQAASEVLESLAPVVDNDPIYQRNAILERMVEPLSLIHISSRRAPAWALRCWPRRWRLRKRPRRRWCAIRR